MPSVFSYLNSSHNRSWPTVWKIVILLSMYSWCDSMILYKPSHFSSHFVHLFLNVCTYWALEWVSESYSVMSDSLRPHGLNSLWNSPGQDTGVGSFSLLQGIFPTQGSNPGLPHCRWSLYQLNHKGSPRTLEWVAYPFSRDLPNQGWAIREAWKEEKWTTKKKGKIYPPECRVSENSKERQESLLKWTMQRNRGKQ